MGDIQKCKGTKCAIKKQCYRYKAREGFKQVWGKPEFKDGKCLMFWKIREELKSDDDRDDTCYNIYNRSFNK